MLNDVCVVVVGLKNETLLIPQNRPHLPWKAACLMVRRVKVA